MTRVLILQGPNLNLLGSREPEIYGAETLEDIHRAISARAAELNLDVVFFQSNHEGALIDRLETLDYDAVVCNFGALSHTSYALHDALVAADRPAVEVHISDITAREPWRRVSVTAPATSHQVIGRGWRGYLEAIDWLLDGVTERS
jgi:3-dehydroquinate dehydratase-2